MMREFFKIVVRSLLKPLAKIYIWRTKPHIVVIAGTTARYWVKEAVVEALKEKGLPVRANVKHFNAEIGLPLSILNLPSGEGSFWGWAMVLKKAAAKTFGAAKIPKENLILEMAIDHPDNMNYLLSIVKPQVAILTTVTMIYQEHFENLDEIAREYQKLANVLPANGLLVLNADDERIFKLKKFASCPVTSYGIENKEADYLAKNIKKNIDGQTFELRRPRAESETIKINRFGQHHIYAALVKKIVAEKIKIN